MIDPSCEMNGSGFESAIGLRHGNRLGGLLRDFFGAGLKKLFRLGVIEVPVGSAVPVLVGGKFPLRE